MRSEAQKKADKAYQARKIADGTNKRLGLTLKAADFDMIEDYSKIQNLSKAQTIIKAIRYCIDHDIDLNRDSNSAEMKNF